MNRMIAQGLQAAEQYIAQAKNTHVVKNSNGVSAGQIGQNLNQIPNQNQNQNAVNKQVTMQTKFSRRETGFSEVSTQVPMSHRPTQYSQMTVSRSVTGVSASGGPTGQNLNHMHNDNPHMHSGGRNEFNPGRNDVVPQEDAAGQHGDSTCSAIEHYFAPVFNWSP